MSESGIVQVEYKVLIEPEQVNEQTSGGLYLPQQTKEKDEMAQVKGTLVAVGGSAFEDWQGRRPEIGDKDYFGKYAGFVVVGADERKYRLINDKDVAAIIE